GCTCKQVSNSYRESHRTRVGGPVVLHYAQRRWRNDWFLENAALVHQYQCLDRCGSFVVSCVSFSFVLVGVISWIVFVSLDKRTIHEVTRTKHETPYHRGRL